ncbi:MAG: winged helix-turn-helix domain-containing protein [Candidatus Pacearchaeota archaeon]|jgi:predicted transcriptional regulator
MPKRGKSEIIKDILEIVQKSKNKIRPTPLMRQSNLSTARFKEYFKEITEKNFAKEINFNEGKFILLTEKGFRFLEKYKSIINFIDEFEL